MSVGAFDSQTLKSFSEGLSLFVPSFVNPPQGASPKLCFQFRTTLKDLWESKDPVFAGVPAQLLSPFSLGPLFLSCEDEKEFLTLIGKFPPILWIMGVLRRAIL